MTNAISHTGPLEEPRLLAFLDDIREFNENAMRISRMPVALSTGKGAVSLKEFGTLLDRVEHSVRQLRRITSPAAPAYRRARQVDTRAATEKRGGAASTLVLDTTEAMIEKGQLVGPDAFKELMGWSTRQALSKAALTHRVFYVPYKAERYYPAFFADPAYERKHLEAVSRLLGDLPGGSKLQFFLTKKGSLGGETPLQALAHGRLAKVRDVAAAFAEVPAQT